MTVQETSAVVIRVADIDRFRLLVWELRMLTDAMRLVNDPRAAQLERILDRFTDHEDEHEAD